MPMLLGMTESLYSTKNRLATNEFDITTIAVATNLRKKGENKFYGTFSEKIPTQAKTTHQQLNRQRFYNKFSQILA